MKESFPVNFVNQHRSSGAPKQAGPEYASNGGFPWDGRRFFRAPSGGRCRSRKRREIVLAFYVLRRLLHTPAVKRVGAVVDKPRQKWRADCCLEYSITVSLRPCVKARVETWMRLPGFPHPHRRGQQIIERALEVFARNRIGCLEVCYLVRSMHARVCTAGPSQRYFGS